MADYAKGPVLIELRKKAGLTREQAAAELGFTTKTLFTWEKENGGIRAENARRLAEFYGIDDPGTLTTSTEEGGDQLDRLEAKLNALLLHFDLTDALTAAQAQALRTGAEATVEFDEHLERPAPPAAGRRKVGGARKTGGQAG